MTQTIYAAIDASGQPYEIPQDAAFTTHTVLVTSEEEAAWSFTPVGGRAPFELSHPLGALRLYGQADLDRYGIVKLALGAPPAGKVLGGYELATDDEGRPMLQPAWETPPSPPVPQRVSRMQAKLALHAAGLLDDVEAAIAAAPREVQIYWAEVSELHRDHTILTQMTTALGWTSEQVDDLFRTAAAIR